jgi:hypothetical protein
LDDVERRKFMPYPDSNSNLSVFQLVAALYYTKEMVYD